MKYTEIQLTWFWLFTLLYRKVLGDETIQITIEPSACESKTIEAEVLPWQSWCRP